jgi:methylated-DNA-[protein]-cysteine S-methyltransferase
MMIYTCTVESPLGTLRAAGEDDCLTGLWFEGQKHYPEGAELWRSEPGYPVFGKLRQWLDEYFSGKRPAAGLPLAPAGGEFRQAVWNCIREISYGNTSSYGEIARKIGAGKKSASCRAVGGAVGHNPISLLIPCHRVVGSDGRLTGYAGGIEKKKFLLELEQGLVPAFGEGGHSPGGRQ